MPHSGTRIPDDIVSRLTDRAKTLPDTDWHIPRLYDFAFTQGHSVLQASFGRYVVDLNRPPNNESLYPGQATTGLCPDTLFDGEQLYLSGENPGEAEVIARRDKYWVPYHDKLAQTLEEIRNHFGYAILYDAHSIASRVPRLFEGRLPDLNLGTANGASCRAGIQNAVSDAIERSLYQAVVNGRFRGGYITRHYGDPDKGIHALQMEIAQCNYMNETPDFSYDEARAATLKTTLQAVFDAMITSGAQIGQS
jgi:N-formylglutamate amidohydrolase